TIERGHGVLGERNVSYGGAQLAPEALAHQSLVLLHPGAAGGIPSGIRSVACSHDQQIWAVSWLAQSAGCCIRCATLLNSGSRSARPADMGKGRRPMKVKNHAAI